MAMGYYVDADPVAGDVGQPDQAPHQCRGAQRTLEDVQ
jgi:hypothetical protein